MHLFARSGLVVALLCLPAANLAAGERVTVRALSGRQFHGEVDPRTSEESLWLRSGKPHTFVSRPINWSRVQTVEARGSQYTADEFRSLIVRPDWQWADDPFADETSPIETTTQPEAAAYPEERSHSERTGRWDPIDTRPQLPEPVMALHIDAYVANWDSDVEVDGLVVHAYPLDAYGATIPAHGILDVELVGEGPTNLASGNPFPQLGRWSQAVEADNVGTNGAVFRLPFQGVHPDFPGKWNVGSFGMVHARLSVSGQGVFEDTAAFTRIRPFSPIRDRMQQLHDRRFLPAELTDFSYR